jgi:hypothetical protein
VKRLKVVQISPSSLAKSSKYESLQRTPREKILDDRPRNDDIPPASLLYEGFGEFLDIVAGRADVEGCNDVDALKLMNSRSLCVGSSPMKTAERIGGEHSSTESSRQEETTPVQSLQPHPSDL